MPTIKGNSSDNRLIGESNVFGVTNHMYGYGGNDTLEGGMSADNYIWGGTGNDTISGGVDLNRLYGEDGNDYIKVFWNAPDSQLFGGAGNDTLEAGDGGNYLDGGTGIDHMAGAKGGDTFIVDNAKDRVIENWVPEFDNVPNPTDIVRTSVSYALDISAQIEIFEPTNSAGTKAIKLTGSNASQTITGNAGNNILDGKGGNDVLVGGVGVDVLIGGSGNDTASYATAKTGLTANLTKPTLNTGEAQGDTFTSVENLLGSAFNDKLYGDKVANTLSGGAGNDYLVGYNGKDTLTGGVGDDRLVGGLDNDILAGGIGKDTFVFHTALSATNIDKITDFAAKDDVIHLENAVFTKLIATGALAASAFVANASGTAADKFDRIVYETDTGKLFYDADGSGKGTAIQFATLKAGLALAADDFFVI